MRAGSSMRRENGVWVFRSGKAIPAEETEEALQRIRRTRELSIRGD
jgi:hypothetical protein